MKVRGFVMLVGGLALLWTRSAAIAQEALGPAVLPPPQSLPPVTEPDFDSLLPEIVPPGATDAQPAALDGTLEATITPTPHWYQPAYWWGPEPWGAGVELGINGSEGNNNVFSMRAGGHLKRETERWKLDSSLSYNKNHSNGVETQNNGKHDLRLDRNLAKSRWTLFVLENLIYDEFQSYDLQLSLNTGVGYRWIKTPLTDLLTRLGAGATREFGGVENDWQPQTLFGVDASHQLSPMQRLTAKVDYFPEWEDYRNYRVVTDVGWEIKLDRPENMSLKLSVIDRYDSTPDGAVPNNVDYALLLIWGL